MISVLDLFFMYQPSKSLTTSNVLSMFHQSSSDFLLISSIKLNDSRMHFPCSSDPSFLKSNMLVALESDSWLGFLFVRMSMSLEFSRSNEVSIFSFFKVDLNHLVWVTSMLIECLFVEGLTQVLYKKFSAISLNLLLEGNSLLFSNHFRYTDKFFIMSSQSIESIPLIDCLTNFLILLNTWFFA